jgi:hypothetical protein
MHCATCVTTIQSINLETGMSLNNCICYIFFVSEMNSYMYISVCVYIITLLISDQILPEKMQTMLIFGNTFMMIMN